MSSPPHIRQSVTTRALMADVLIALVPAMIWGVYVFGFRALSVVTVSVTAAVLSEFLFETAVKRPVTVNDLSAVVTGVLLAFCCPVSVPLWIPALGSAFAVILVKQLFGGIGKNIVNPALAGRVFLFTSWPVIMKVFTAPFEKLPAFSMTVSGTDAVTSATTLSYMKAGGVPSGEFNLMDLMIGNKAGCIGEISGLLLIAGGIYLIYRRVISWHIPVSFLGTVLVVTLFFQKGLDVLSLDYSFYHLFSGGLVLGAVFMATDYATSPVTKNGKIIFGVGCGLLTVFIRYFGGYPEGVSFAILIMNLFVWYIDKYTKPKAYGAPGRAAGNG